MSDKLLFPQAGDEKVTAPSDSIRATLELSIAVSPEQLARITKDGKYDAAWLSVYITQVLLKTENSQLPSWVSRSIIPFRKVGLSVHNDAVADVRQYGEWLLAHRTPEPSKTAPKAPQTMDALPSLDALPTSGTCELADSPRFSVVSNYRRTRPDHAEKKISQFREWCAQNWTGAATDQAMAILKTTFLQQPETIDFNGFSGLLTGRVRVPLTDDAYKGMLLSILADQS